MRDLLCAGLNQLQLQLHERQIEQLLDYLSLLQKWNKAYNLTAIRDPEQMVVQHLLDSLAIAPYIIGNKILDVGTGAGLPGIPLAITFPDKHFTLLDSNGKKTRFVQQAKRELQLANVEVTQARVEELDAGEGFDLITSRAFADIALMLKLTKHLLAPGGRIAAMKGPRAEDELAPVREQISDLAIHSLDVPMLQGERHLVCFNIRSADSGAS